MKITGKIISAILALVMLTCLVPGPAFAAETVAVVVYADSSHEGFSSFAAAWKAAVRSNNATIELYASYMHHAGENAYVLPAGKTVTVELLGNALLRNITESRSDGSVFDVQDNATLFIYGGTKAYPASYADKEHDLPVYVANADRLGYTRKNVKLYGGVIHGGNSSRGGGGIIMREGAKVYLYHVTVAGNYADRSGANYGDGGGVEMNNAYGYLYLEDSRICYNGARYDGGGVHVDAAYCTVEMVRSHIDHNVADDNGGGIYVDGDVFKLRGDAEQFKDPETVISANEIKDWDGAYDYFIPDALGSSVSYNCVFDSEDGGGGIYADNPTALIEGVNIAGNVANDGGYGGGLYLNDEGITVRSCNILRNKAENRGGGVYVNDENNVVDSCTVYGNLSWIPGGGGGVYLPSTILGSYHLAVSGPVIVRGNVSRSYSDDNLFLASSTSGAEAYLIPSTTPGADIHVRLSGGHSSRVSKSAGTYNISHFAYDNDTAHYIGWNSDWSDRFLKVVSGAKPARPAAATFTPDAGGRTQTVAGGYTVDGTNYPLIKGVFSYPSFPDDSADVENVFYYSDGFFAGDPNTYNEHLATASLCLAAAAGYSNIPNADGKVFEGSGLNVRNDYLDKSKNFRQLVSDIGCADEDIFVNDFDLQKPGADTVGVGIASKKIFTDKTLVIIGVRGMGYESEWISNMTLGSNGEAQGWSSAAAQVMAELKAYLARRGIDGASEDTVFWIAGYSRAGATSNLTAKRIVDTYDNSGTHTFAYPLEAPMGGVASEIIAGNNYNCIHNVVNQNDIVPWVGTTEMGFIRYGVDHYVPGDPATHAPSDGNDNNKIPEDNAAWDVEGGSYQRQRTTMLAQLAAVNPDIIFDDYFHQATVNYLMGLAAGLTDPIGETGDHENEIGTTERFIKVFFEMLQEYGFKYDLYGNEVHKKPREYFSQYAVKNNRTFQQAAASTAALIFGKSDEDVAGLMECFSGLTSRLKFPDTLSLYMNIDNGDDIDDLESEIENLWAHLTTVNEEDAAKGYRSIKEYLTDKEYRELSDCYKSLLFPLLCFAGEDNAEWGQDILGTMAYNIPRIISNHYPEVTHAWLRSYDSFYESDTRPVTMAASTAPSAVAVEVIHADASTDLYDPAVGVISVKPDDVVRLVPAEAADRDAGEAIYYQFTSGKTSVQGTHAFAEPFRLKSMLTDYATGDTFTLLAVAAHNGQKRDPVTVTLQLDGDATVSVPTSYDAVEQKYTYTNVSLTGGQSNPLKFNPPNGTDTFQFKKWTVYAYDPSTGMPGAAISPSEYVEYFGPDFSAKAAETTVANLAGVSARFEPSYDKVVPNLTVSFDGAADEGGLPSVINCYQTGGDTLGEGCPIAWTYRTGNDTAPYYIGSFSIVLPENVTLPALKDLTVEWEGLDGYQIPEPTVVKLVVSEQSESGSRARFDLRFAPKSRTEQNAPPLLGAPLLGAPADPIGGNKAVVRIYDMNLGRSVDAYTFYSDEASVKVSAPAIENMEFMMWQDTGAKDLVREASDNDELVACYAPVVNRIEVTLAGPLAPGKALPDLESVIVTVSNRWRIDSAALYWVGSDTAAGYDTAYTARIRMDNLTGINLSVEGSGSQALTGAVAFAKTSDVIVKDTKGKAYAAEAYLLGDSLWLAFEKTPKPQIVALAPVSAGAASSGAQISMAYAYLEDGRMVLVDVSGGLDAYYDYYEVTQEAEAALTANGPAELEQIAPPAATPSGGSYPAAPEIRLTAEEGAVIRYAIAVTENGALPKMKDLSYREYTGPFTLTAPGKTAFLFAYAQKEGTERSAAIRYVYDLTAAPAPDPGAYVPPAPPTQPSGTPAPVDFTDVGETDWFYDAVQFAAQRGFFLGTGEGLFSPGMPMTRGMFMTVLARMSGETVDGADWQEKGMAWAVENGVSDGSAPDRPISRQEIVTMLWRFAGAPAPRGDLSGHPDGGEVDDWAAKAAAWAVENGVMQGDQNGYLHLRDAAVRAEVAAMLMRYCTKIAE